MNRRIDSAFRKRYVEELRAVDPELASKFSTLHQETQRRWIGLMEEYGIKVQDAVRALREYLHLVPPTERTGELALEGNGSDEE